MSDELVGRYKRAYPRIWRHPGFRKLTPACEQRLALYLLTGPQTNRIGLFHFSLATAAEDLSLGVDTLRKGLPNVLVTFGWLFDADALVMFIPSWWRWNRPDNENVLRGNLKDLSEIPPCALADAFATNVAYVPANLREMFIETLRERLPRRPPTQDQDQDQDQDQEAGTRAARGEPGAGAPVPSPPKKESGEESSEKGLKLQIAAREALNLNGWNASTDDQLDTMRQVMINGGDPVEFRKREGLEALTAVKGRGPR